MGDRNVNEEALATTEGESDHGITEILQQVHREMTVQAEELGIYGAAIQYLAEELKHIFLKSENLAE